MLWSNTWHFTRLLQLLHVRPYLVLELTVWFSHSSLVTSGHQNDTSIRWVSSPVWWLLGPLSAVFLTGAHNDLKHRCDSETMNVLSHLRTNCSAVRNQWCRIHLKSWAVQTKACCQVLKLEDWRCVVLSPHTVYQCSQSSLWLWTAGA